MWKQQFLQSALPRESWAGTVNRQKYVWAGLQENNLDRHRIYVTRPRPDQLKLIHATLQARQGHATMLLGPEHKPLELLQVNPLCLRVVAETTAQFRSYRGEPPTTEQCTTLCPLGQALRRSCCEWTAPDDQARRQLVAGSNAEYNRWAMSWRQPELKLWPAQPMLDALSHITRTPL